MLLPASYGKFLRREKRDLNDYATNNMNLLKRSLAWLLALAMILPLIYFEPISNANAAVLSSSVFDSYAANLSVKTTKVVNLLDAATSSATAKYTLPADTMLTVKALHKDSSGKYFYEVLYYDMTLYIDATATTLVDHLTGDITVTDLFSPAAIGLGQGFPIGGTVSSTLNILGNITAAVHYSSNINGSPAIVSHDTVNGYSYTLDNSTLDNNLIMSDLPAGSYTYLLTVEAISYYINDNGELDTSVQTVVLDSKPCVVTDASNPNPVIAKGIDVSIWNGTIDWSKASQVVDFAILRIGYEYTLDTQFTNNAAGCNKYGVPFGVYIYSYAESEAEAIKEAEFVISVLKNYDVDLPIFFDIEDDVHKVLSSTQIQNIVKAFCETIRDAGYEPGLYTFLSWFNSHFGGTYYNSLPKWVAQIDVNKCSYTKGLTMWQYSWVGSISGISGDVDCNYHYGEFPGKNTDTSYLGSCTYYPSNAVATINSAVNVRKYPSTDYSIVTELAADTKVHITGLYKNTYGHYWYQIETDNYSGYIDAGYATVSELLYDDLSVMNPTMDDLALNAGYYLKGKVYSKYNQLAKVYGKVYNGEDTLASPVLTSGASVEGKSYTLNYSEVCDNLIFSDLETGYYTYEISADVTNYYFSDGALQSESDNVVVWTKPFTVGDATITPPANVACDHNTVTDAAVAPTCTATGLTEGSHCTKCGVVFTEQTVVPALGHSYSVTSHDATCVDYELFHYECSKCGDSYDISADDLAQWRETKPLGIPESLIESKTQYRYADCTSQSWFKQSSNSVEYVPTWASGFDTSNGVYAQYNNVSKKVIASETDTTKVVIDSDSKIGYLYYHWCSTTVTSSWGYQTGDYNTFHVYYDTTDPSNYSCDTSDYSYKTSHSSCSNSAWWFPVEVYRQDSSTYTKEFDGKTWGAWSAWSDTAYTAVENTRKVESRTVYRYTGAALSDHSWSNGTCSVCGTTCSHDGYTTTCGICGMELVKPEITPKYPALNFEDEVHYNIYFTTSGMDDVAYEDMGLIGWTSPQSAGTIADAEMIAPGAVSGNGMLMVHSEGIPAKNLADTMYFKVYAKLADGSYVYSSMFGYSAKAYATDRLANSSNQQLKALCVAMLNYGAAAQVQFNYKPYNLMNASLTDEQKAYVDSYSSDMIAPITPASSSKIGAFSATGGFSYLAPAVSFEGAFAINYYFTPANAVEGDLMFYYWTQDDYNKASVLTTQNASGSAAMTLDSETGRYAYSYTGIAAKQLDETVYVSGVYRSNGNIYCTGVIAYSLGAYCKDRINNSSEASMVALAKGAAVYGYYAKNYFAALSA